MLISWRRRKKVLCMINDRSLARFEPLGSKLLKPIYADYSFGNIANTVHFLLTGERLGNLLPEDCFGGPYPKPQKVVLFLLDAFGWQSWQRYGDQFAATRRVMQDGVLTPISALFPSTTSASVSTMNLGVLPAKHALYEWQAYIPEYGEVIYTLPFMPIGSNIRDSCKAEGHDPAKLLAVHETVYQRLAPHGVKSYQVMERALTSSSYNTIASQGATMVPYTTLAEGMLKLRQAVEASQDKSYFYFYWPSIDSITHKYGPGSDFQAAEAAAYWQTFEAILSGMQSPDTLFLFIADHDQVGGKPEDTIYINRQLPQLADILPISPTGRTIYPNGSPRDLFLHVKPERRAEALGLLQQNYSGIAEIMTVDDALALGLFGPEPISDILRPRLGDILILPHDGQFISWWQTDLMENHKTGAHGGLAAAELITVFGVMDSL
jgi:predicted AlkP superfamily pyrophosphatase or phosphodiesterase